MKLCSSSIQEVAVICQPYQTSPPQNSIAATQLNASNQRRIPDGSCRNTRSGRTWPSNRTSWLAAIITPQMTR